MSITEPPSFPSALLSTEVSADLGVSYCSSVPLLERELPLATLVDRAARAAAGQGSVVLVAGEAGIGKTVLLRAFAERVRGSVQPLWGRCDSLSTPRPLGPLRDVAHELPAVAAMLWDGAAAADRVLAERHVKTAMEILSAAGDQRELGFAVGDEVLPRGPPR